MIPSLEWSQDEYLGVFRSGHEQCSQHEQCSVVINMVYGDLSGDDASIITAGCYLGKEDDWMNAIAAWCSALADAEVDEFHATDFYNAKDKFDHDRWRYEVPGRGLIVGGDLHVEYAKRFAAIPVDAGLIGFALAIDAPAFLKILAPEMRKEKRTHLGSHLRTYAVMNNLSGVAEFLVKTTDRTKGGIQVVWEQEKGDKRFSSFFEESQARRERWTYWFKSFTTAPKSFVPLQMADLLAHEAWRRVKEIQSQVPRPVRKSFERMLVDGHVDVRWMGREHCEAEAQQVREVLARFPDGLIPSA